MEHTLTFDTTKPVGGFKPMNAVNNGPQHMRHAIDQAIDNLAAYRAARIPFARNHDASFYYRYGGQFSVDVRAIFPDFDADVNDPASYDFACTDEYIAVTLEAGTETFYRLGQKIEHEIRKHFTLPPKDYLKWAEICEHIIRHYNEGWADGYHHNIRYWEIWNELDLDPDGAKNKRTWGGTDAEYHAFFDTVMKHLKSRFPHLKIGGPALAYDLGWAERFLAHVSENHIPLDFFSWHIYCTSPEIMMDKNARVQALLDRYGFGNVENILNEWNYVRSFEDDYAYSVKSVLGLKGSSFTLACMCEAQRSTIDMLMYYDARPNCALNGLFAPYTLEPLKGYYPFLWFGMLYGRREIRAEEPSGHIYSLCGIDENGKTLTLLTHYADDDAEKAETVTLDFGKKENAVYEVSLLDETHDGIIVGTTQDLTFTLPLHTSLMIREL